MSDGQWLFFNYDPETLKTQYMRVLENGQIQMRETIPMWLAQKMLDENKARAKEFTENGGWSGHKNGAVVAAIPHHIDQHFKHLSGLDLVKTGGWYDRDKYTSLLDDSDYAALRTGGGKLGKRKAMI